MSFKTFRPQKDRATGKPTGILEVDPIKKYTRARWFIPNNQANLPAAPWTVVLAAGGQSGPIPVEFDAADGHAEIFGLMVLSTGDFTIRIEDPGLGYSWQNRDLHIRTIAGTAQLPYYFPTTYQMNVEGSQRELLVYLTDISGAPNTIRLAFFGRSFKHEEAPGSVVRDFEKRLSQRALSRLQFITTSLPLTAVTAAASPYPNIDFIVPTDFGFELMKLTAASFAAGATFEMELTEARDGSKFHQDGLRVHNTLMWGIGTFPFILAETYVMPKKYRMRGTLWVITAGPLNLFLTMAGRQIRTTVPTIE